MSTAAARVCNAFQDAACQVAETVRDAGTSTTYELKKESDATAVVASLLDIARELIGVDD